MKAYKLTTQTLTTHNGFQWEVGKEVTTDGSGELCSKGWLHFYYHPLLAELLNPIHAQITNPRLWEVNVAGTVKDDLGRKGGCTQLTLIKEIPLTNITTIQRVAFAILCAQQLKQSDEWLSWSNNWLSGKDRTTAAAYAAANAAAAADAANAAAYAADAAYAAARAAAARAAAANAAAYAAATDTLKLLISCAEKCLEY